MGFYFRKSINFGGVRFNFSKSGIGMSAGVKGFRIGTGPRGNYVHMGRHGLYYRAALGKKDRAAKNLRHQHGITEEQEQNGMEFKDIDSIDISQISDFCICEVIE